MNLEHELIDLISSIQMLDKHYDETFSGIEDDLAELRRCNVYLDEQNKMLSKKLDALIDYLEVEIKFPDTSLKAVKLDKGISNN
tara:strand:- start:421 stop:672 length:252 start_codon:yes stop_codon:yes gene_type:complete